MNCREHPDPNIDNVLEARRNRKQAESCNVEGISQGYIHILQRLGAEVYKSEMALQF